MKTLHLNLKKKWFDMILSGEKTEEYRDIKMFWLTRLVDFKEETERQVLDEIIYDMNNPVRHKSTNELMDYFNLKFREYASIIFSNGYAKNRPQFEIELKFIYLSVGMEKWGAEYNKIYFVLKLGKIKANKTTIGIYESIQEH